MPHRSAAAPSRATTTITLSVGVLAVPLSVFTGTEATRVARKEFAHGDTNRPVGRLAYDKTAVEADGTITALETTDVVRMAQATSGAWVELTDDEIADCTSPKGLAEVECFVPLKDTNQYLTEGLVQVRPKRDKSKPNPAAEKAFALLLAGMKARKVAALVKVAMRGPARYALLLPTGDMLLVLTADAIREARDLPESSYSKAELAMVGTLIDAIGVDAPVITDDTAPVVQAFVDAKAKGIPAPVKQDTPAIPCDIMESLSASVDAAKARKGKVA